MKNKTKKKKIGIEIPLSIYKRTKIASVMIDKHFQDIVADALKKELDRLGIPLVNEKE